MGFWTSVALVLGGIGFAASQAAGAKKAAAAPAQPASPKATPPPVPKVEDVKKEAEASTKAAVKEKKRAIARSKTIFTSPLGLQEDAAIARKTLTGQ